MSQPLSGGDLLAEVLVQQGVELLFTLCGGHISPILVSAKQRGIRIIDVRDEASAAFAADAVSRLTGAVGVAAVTAGPGVTNTLTAVKNAQLAQSPMVLLGGATATILKGRGALQDIDQMALIKPHVKWATAVTRVNQLVPALERAFLEARRGVPGPVFVEVPVDLLYQQDVVRQIYGVGPQAAAPKSRSESMLRWYLTRHLRKIFGGAEDNRASEPQAVQSPRATEGQLRHIADAIAKAQQPVILVGSQAVAAASRVEEVAAALAALEIPCFLSGMARGLLGAGHRLHLRHQRRAALQEADLILLLGVPCDFRLDYGRSLSRRAKLVSINLSAEDLKKNRKPQIGVLAEPGDSIIRLAAVVESGAERWASWLASLRQRDLEREADIDRRAAVAAGGGINPLRLFRQLDAVLEDDSVLVADGGDFVATASYTLRPRGPLRWLDPGVFGTLGVGGGFALGAKLTRPEAEVWLLWGDGSSAYTLAEFDTYVRHQVPVIAVVGNDASWMQIAREQVEVLGDSCATDLRHTDYHRVAEGYGGKGLLLDREEDIPRVLAEAKAAARQGIPVLVNVILGKTDFRKGSISM